MVFHEQRQGHEQHGLRVDGQGQVSPSAGYPCSSAIAAQHGDRRASELAAQFSRQLPSIRVPS
jgi:hypothetical protein